MRTRSRTRSRKQIPSCAPTVYQSLHTAARLVGGAPGRLPYLTRAGHARMALPVQLKTESLFEPIELPTQALLAESENRRAAVERSKHSARRVRVRLELERPCANATRLRARVLARAPAAMLTAVTLSAAIVRTSCARRCAASVKASAKLSSSDRAAPSNAEESYTKYELENEITNAYLCTRNRHPVIHDDDAFYFGNRRRSYHCSTSFLIKILTHQDTVVHTQHGI